MTINAKCMEVIGVFVSYLLFVNYNVSCYKGDWDEREISNIGVRNGSVHKYLINLAYLTGNEISWKEERLWSHLFKWCNLRRTNFA